MRYQPESNMVVSTSAKFIAYEHKVDPAASRAIPRPNPKHLQVVSLRQLFHKVVLNDRQQELRTVQIQYLDPSQSQKVNFLSSCGHQANYSRQLTQSLTRASRNNAVEEKSSFARDITILWFWKLYLLYIDSQLRVIVINNYIWLVCYKHLT